jgi:inner membrane protein
MATDYTHALAGLGIAYFGASRPMPWSYWTLAVILPVIPDLDVFSTADYGTMLGHRGITHSLVFALTLSLVAASIVRWHTPVRWWKLTSVFFAIIASHGLLDALTWGGEAIPFFWPLGGRYGNWGPLPLSDIALDLPNPWTSRAIRSELLWVWLPIALSVILVAVCRRHRKSSHAGCQTESG